VFDALDFVDTSFGETIAVIENYCVFNSVNIAGNAAHEAVNIRGVESFCGFEPRPKVINSNPAQALY